MAWLWFRLLVCPFPISCSAEPYGAGAAASGDVLTRTHYATVTAGMGKLVTRTITYTYDGLYPVERGERPPDRGRLFQRRAVRVPV